MFKKIITIAIAVVFTATFISSNAEAAVVKQVKGLKSPDTSITTVTLKWNKAKRAKAYQIYQLKGKKYRKVKTVKVRTTKIKNLKPNKVYKFKVRGIRGKRKGKFSKVIKPRTRCKVTFKYKNNKGKNVTTVRGVKKGATVKAPMPGDYQTKTHKYTFVKWSTSLKINKNVTITASYTGKKKTQTNPQAFSAKKCLEYVNAERKKLGREPLVLNDIMNQAANEKAKRVDEYLEEDSDNLHYAGGSFFVDSFCEPYGIYIAGEVIAFPGTLEENIAFYTENADIYGTVNIDISKMTVEDWMNSEGHKNIIMSKKAKSIGFGEYNGVVVGITSTYVTE